MVIISGLLSSIVRWTASPDSISMALGYSSGGLIHWLPVTLWSYLHLLPPCLHATSIPKLDAYPSLWLLIPAVPMTLSIKTTLSGTGALVLSATAMFPSTCPHPCLCPCAGVMACHRLQSLPSNTCVGSPLAFYASPTLFLSTLFPSFVTWAISNCLPELPLHFSLTFPPQALSPAENADGTWCHSACVWL